MFNTRVLSFVCSLGAVTVLSGGGAAASPDSSYVAEVLAWRAERLERLVSPTGWLAIAGLHWLEPGENAFGSDPKGKIVLPEGAPARAGMLRLVQGGKGVLVNAAPGVALYMDSTQITEDVLPLDEEGSSPMLRLGRLQFWVISRGGRHAVRVRDPESPIRKNFQGLDWYGAQARYRVEGKLEPLPAPKEILVPNIVGYVDSMLTPGPVAFVLEGKPYRLTPLIEAPKDSNLFFVFQDSTSGIETYGGGRFLYADLEADGRVILDFNKAYNPPCAYNPHTTCPLPPEGNVLPVALRAGEKKYHGAEH